MSQFLFFLWGMVTTVMIAGMIDWHEQDFYKWDRGDYTAYGVFSMVWVIVSLAAIWTFF
jgi:hypothetical protein